MAARGSQAKESITKKILEVFEGSFLNDKEIRVPITENGEIIEVKVTLTAAKENIGGAAAPVRAPETVTPADRTITPSEKAAVKSLIAEWGL